MMRIILSAVIFIFVLSCSTEKSDFEKNLEKSVSTSGNRLDSIDKRFNSIKKYIEMGYSTERAEEIVDSSLKAEANFINALK